METLRSSSSTHHVYALKTPLKKHLQFPIPLKFSPPTYDSLTLSFSRAKSDSKSMLSKFFNFLDDCISHHLDPPMNPAFDPEKVLSGNFAPVGELPPTPCAVVEGEIPASVRGVYIRNGSNPQFVPRGPYYPFDGDGMVHAVSINGTKEVNFCCRFVKTNKYEAEHEAGYPFFLSVFTSFRGVIPSIARVLVFISRFITGECDLRRGIGVANTSVSYFGGKLFALCESDLPYELKLTPDGDVLTLGRVDSFGGSGPFSSMTAHPKIDPDSGEAFAYRTSFFAPFVAYFTISPHGIKQPEVPISSFTEFSMIHDFAISKNYAILSENQIVFRPENILKFQPFITVDPAKSPRVTIIPRYAKDDGDIVWVDSPGLNMLHSVNAWEEDGIVVLVATDTLEVWNFLEEMDSPGVSLNLIEINLTEKTARLRRLSADYLDLAVINPDYVGKKNRYIYAGIGAPMPRTSGVVKLDLSLSSMDSPVDCTVARRDFPAGCYGSEPFYLARDPKEGEGELGEDEGYIMSYIHNENIGESSFIIMDAKSPTLDIVATVKLPQRVPYGYHGAFVHQSLITKD